MKVDDNTWNNSPWSAQGKERTASWQRPVWWLLLLLHGPGWTRASGPSSLPSSTYSCLSDCPVSMYMGWESTCTSSIAITWPGRRGPSSRGMPPPPRWGPFLLLIDHSKEYLLSFPKINLQSKLYRAKQPTQLHPFIILPNLDLFVLVNTCSCGS